MFDNIVTEVKKVIHYNVIRTKHNGREKPDFKLVRPNGTDDYLFLHFKTPVIFTLFNKVHHISSGMCILLCPGTPHSFFPDNCELIHDWMHFMPSDDSAFKKLKIDINTFFTADNLSFITATIKRCELELIYKDELYEELISSEVSGMFISLKRQLSGSISGYHADAFKALRIDIYRNPDKYTSTGDMANLIGLSRSRFSIVYKEFFGVSPKKDLINARISKASHLLSSETPSLTEISEECGYQSTYHFIRQFRDITGITPGKYRRNH